MTESKHEDIEDEEILVYADFDSVLDERMFQKDALFKMISLDSEEPFLQIGTQVYSGEWTDSVGTHLFFEPKKCHPATDPVFSDTPENILNFKFKTRKCLQLSRIFINKKEDEECTDASVEEIEYDSRKNTNDKKQGTKEDNTMDMLEETFKSATSEK